MPGANHFRKPACRCTGSAVRCPTSPTKSPSRSCAPTAPPRRLSSCACPARRSWRWPALPCLSCRHRYPATTPARSPCHAKRCSRPPPPGASAAKACASRGWRCRRSKWSTCARASSAGWGTMTCPTQARSTCWKSRYWPWGRSRDRCGGANRKVGWSKCPRPPRARDCANSRWPRRKRPCRCSQSWASTGIRSKIPGGAG